jgi:predicted RNA-binding Zn ribbon-like protein
MHSSVRVTPSDLGRDALDFVNNPWTAPEAATPPANRLASLPLRRTLEREATQLRLAIDRLLEAHAGGGPLPHTALFVLNRALNSSRSSVRLALAEDGLKWIEDEVGTHPLALLAPAARSAGNILLSVAPHRLRRCAAEACERWFIDTSKNGRRRWCSMERCGNRAKAARHRAKRATAAGR